MVKIIKSRLLILIVLNQVHTFTAEVCATVGGDMSFIIAVIFTVLKWIQNKSVTTQRAANGYTQYSICTPMRQIPMGNS